MFTNACEGVKKIYKAEILSLIATVLLLIGSVISVFGIQAGENTSSGEGLLVSGGLIVIVAAVLLIIAAIMNIIGVSRASKDEAAFKNALIALLFGIAANILVSAFSNNPTVSSIGKAAIMYSDDNKEYSVGVSDMPNDTAFSQVTKRWYIANDKPGELGSSPVSVYPQRLRRVPADQQLHPEHDAEERQSERSLLGEIRNRPRFRPHAVFAP